MENIENFLQNLDIESNMVKSEIMKDLKEIIKQIECRKEFNCLTSGLRNQCKAKDIGLESYIECDPETCENDHPALCKSGISFGYSYMCNCPLRVYFCKVLKR